MIDWSIILYTYSTGDDADDVDNELKVGVALGVSGGFAVVVAIGTATIGEWREEDDIILYDDEWYGGGCVLSVSFFHASMAAAAATWSMMRVETASGNIDVVSSLVVIDATEYDGLE